MREKPEHLVESVSAYLMACPLLKDGAFRLDALGDTPTEYVVDIATFDDVVSTYVDGSQEKRYQVTFGSREAYDLDRLQNISNSAFYEDFADWIEAQNFAHKFPDLPEGCYPNAIRTLSPGYLFEEDGKTARYQIPIEITYLKRRKEPKKA